MGAKAQLVRIGGRRRRTLAALSAVETELHVAIRAAAAEGMPIAEISRHARVSRVTIYKILRGQP